MMSLVDRSRCRVLLTSALLSVVALISGCSQDPPSAATVDTHGTVWVLYRSCSGTDVTVGQLDLFDSNDPDARPVWSARLLRGRRGSTIIPITKSIPGYRVIDHLGPGGLS